MTQESLTKPIDANRPHEPSPSIGDVFRAALAGLRDGLVRPSVCAVAIACAINVIAFVVLAVALRPHFLARQNQGLLAATSADYDAFVTSQLFALQESGVKTPLVVLLGGSTTRASLLESDLMRGLDELGYSDWSVVKLCTSRQSLWETLALAESLPLGAKGVVVIGVSASLFTMGGDDLEELARSPRLGIRSDALDDEFRRRSLPVAARTGIHLIDNAAFFLPRLDELLKARLRGSSTEYTDSRYVGSSPVSPVAWARIGKRVDARFADLEANWHRNLAVLDRVINVISDRTDMHVILVETPVNPRFLEEFGRADEVDWHRQRISTFARDRTIPYVSLNDAAGLTARDFVDWAHLHDPNAIRRCANAVLESMSRVVGPRSTAEDR